MALSEYEQERLKNMEENRRILESIRQEQLYSLDIPLARKKNVLTDKKTESNKEAKVKRKKAVKIESTGGNVASPDKENAPPVRKSARLQGKRPKYALQDEPEGDGSDEDYNADGHDDDEDEEYSDEEIESEGRKRRRSVRPAGPRNKVVVPKDRPNHYGAIPGVPVGRIWETRLECCADGVHRPTVAGIHAGPKGAYSIALSGGYEDDIDLGDCFTYTGEGGRELKGTKAKPKNLRTAPQSKDQTLTRGNLALSLNVASKLPVRVIRGYKLQTQFAPEEGYRYDGLYSVEKFWDCIGIAGFKVYKFALRRLPDQAPPPWVYTSPSAQKAVTTGDEKDDDEDADDETSRKPMLVKLFDKK